MFGVTWPGSLGDDLILPDLKLGDDLLQDGFPGDMLGLDGMEGFDLEAGAGDLDLLCEGPADGAWPVTASGGSSSCNTLAAGHHLPSGSGSASPALPLMVGGGTQGGQSRCNSPGATPSTSESGNGLTPPGTGWQAPTGAESSRQAPAAVGTPVVPAATAAPGVASGGNGQQQLAADDEEERRRLVRMERNRQNAHLSRLRRKQLLQDLQTKCGHLQRQNLQLSGLVTRLTTENAALKQQVVLLAVARRAVPAATAPLAGSAPAGSQPAAARSGAAAVWRSAAIPAAAALAVPGAVQPAPAGAAAGAAAAAAARSGGAPSLPFLPFLFPRAARAAAQPAAVQAAGRVVAPAPAPAAPAAAGPAAMPTSRPAAAATGGRSRKRQRAGTSAAATAVLALFSLFMFCQGPLVPSGLRSSSGVGSTPLPALPAAGGIAVADGAGLQRAGRALQALPTADVGGERPVQQPRLLAAEDMQTTPELPASSTHLAQLLNATLEALLEQPGNRMVEQQALARLRELAPVALLLDADSTDGSTAPRPLAASQAFPQLAGQLFHSSGLAAPETCRKILEVDAASVAHALRSRRSLERFLLGQHGFRGRSLADSSLAAGDAEAGAAGGAAGALPRPGLLPTGGDQRGGGHVQGGLLQLEGAANEQGSLENDVATGASSQLLDEPEGGDADRLFPALAPGVGEEPVLVSVLLPVNSSTAGSEEGSSGRQLTAVDKVFVVMLHPRQRYVTYSCSLPQAVLA